jgi:rfaE bifunctional protein nucleotidyltransferase chain/domain
LGEVLTLELARRRRAAVRALQQTYVLTNGCFDLLHPGHLELLRHARRLGHYLLVALNSDRSVAALKGKGRPVQSEVSRAQILAAMADVDGVLIFDEATPLELIRALEPDVLVKGGDYTPDQVVGRDLIEERGGRVVIVPLVPGFSSSELARKTAAPAR